VGLAQNVLPHARNSYLLKIDFVDFFPTIRDRHFVDFMRRAGRLEADVEIMRRVFFKQEKRGEELRLAIGAPSSPTISNILLYELDSALERAVSPLGVTYTRYADDLSFSCSTPGVLPKFEVALPRLIADSCVIGLRINPAKTIHASRKNGRKITGINITPEGTLSVGMARKKLLRAQIHRYQSGLLPQAETESLRGYIAFLQSVEPDHVVRLVRYYGLDLMRQLYPAVSSIAGVQNSAPMFRR
jgi:RNA-directed DNA polymerase